MNPTPSGAGWVAFFPTSRSVNALAEPFRTKVRRFLTALQGGKARVAVNATRRPRERAYLMHYAWLIANGQIALNEVPPMAGVPIIWDHRNLSKSVSAAQAMVDAYDEAYPAALASRHIDGLAIDADIEWDGNLEITGADGAHLSVQTTPRSGLNPALWKIGAGYGVIKLPEDPPHWSSDGH